MKQGSNVIIVVRLGNLFVKDLCDYGSGPLKICPLTGNADAICNFLKGNKVMM